MEFRGYVDMTNRDCVFHYHSSFYNIAHDEIHEFFAKGKGKAVNVQLKSRGTCTVVGTAPADSAGNWQPMKVKRTYKIT